MDLLVTLVGNAAVDPGFRKKFLDDPLGTADAYGFRLTKGDFEIMYTVFYNLTDTQKAELDRVFHALEIALYSKLDAVAALPPKRCMKPCGWSIFPPPEFEDLREIIVEQQQEKEAA